MSGPGSHCWQLSQGSDPLTKSCVPKPVSLRRSWAADARMETEVGAVSRRAGSVELGPGAGILGL